MKKFIAVILTLCVMCSMCTAFAEEEITVTVSDAQAKIGETVEVTVSVKNNPGMAAILFSLKFDKSYLLPVSYEANYDLLTEGIIVSNLDEDAENDLETLDYVTGYWVNVSNNTEDGILFTYKFKIKENAPESIDLTCEIGEDNIVNQESEMLSHKIVNGKITVTDAKEDDKKPTPSRPGGTPGVLPGVNDNKDDDNKEDEQKPAEFEEITFTDMTGHWSYNYVKESVGRKIFIGYEDNTFRPDKGLNRQEMAVAVVRMMGLEDEINNAPATSFTDADKIASWAEKHIALLVSKGIFAGYEDGSFGPTDAISREQFCTVLARALEKTAEEKNLEFKDAQKISTWAEKNVKIMYALGIINGYEDNTFRPQNTVTRAEASAMMVKFINLK